MKLSLKYHACVVGMAGIISGVLSVFYIWSALGSGPSADAPIIGAAVSIIIMMVSMEVSMGFLLIHRQLEKLKSDKTGDISESDR